MSKPRIGVTMGDPAGVGPELCLRLLADPGIREICVPIVFGDADVLARVAEACGSALPLGPRPRRLLQHLIEQRVTEDPDAWQQVTEPAVLHLPVEQIESVRAGAVSATSGRAAYRYVDEAIQAALAGRIDAITTGPLHKEALHAAGIPYCDHTELLTARTASTETCMMLTAPEITCSLVTAHVGLRDVAELLSVERIVAVLRLSRSLMIRLRGREPTMAVCGLNPHAGEHGLFGAGEEERIIAPAVAEAQRLGWKVEGPIPPDTAFLPERRSATDCYVCMYHDQGLIPLKALAFDQAVNVTLGLPIIRTSVDHGTALDLAWQGRASANSLLAATRLAVSLASPRN